jgi:hypothetical protein
MTSIQQQWFGLGFILVVLVCRCILPCKAWSWNVVPSSHQKILKKSIWTMDTEETSPSTTTSRVPRLLQSKWNNVRLHQQQPPKRPFNQFSSTVAAIGTLPWIGNVDDVNTNNVESSNVFLSHWEWQLQFFQQHLTNLRVNPQMYIDPVLYDVQNNNNNDNNNNTNNRSKNIASSTHPRIYTISLQSDEYRDIRMTYLHCGDQAQIFRCTCYPHNDMPILGMGLMQLGRQRNVAIIDFQPLLLLSSQLSQQHQDQSASISYTQIQQLRQQSTYTRRLKQIRSSFPSMQHPMSNRHFDPNEQRYFTAHPIIGKWTSQDENSSQCWQDLQTVHRECVQTHVQLTQAGSRSKNSNNNSTMDDDNSYNTSSNKERDHVHQLHSDYDTFVASKEPASQLLTSAFGKDVAHRLVHQVIFPLSRHQYQL